jgi:hypothetical protein
MTDIPLPNSPQGTFARALAGYDEQFKERMLEAITHAIGMESMIVEDDVRVMMLRTGETVDALITCMISMLALCEDMDVPSHLRETAENIGKRIRRGVAQARADGVFAHFGAAHGGHA